MQEIKRIQKMEQALDEIATAHNALAAALTEFAVKQDQLAELSSYYGSQDYHHDLVMDENGQLPSDLKRGVLSQDTVYDLLIDLHELANEMHRVADGIIDNLSK
ncbi:MAG: DUF4298 domain-containing protein [Proteobacteria bacterium]|nr:DUF4298 domain-containing protein [Pseudomonadota bacterium]